jgi:hypothetical protein
MPIYASLLERNGIMIGRDCIDSLSVLPVESIPFFDDLQIVDEKYAVPVKDNGLLRGFKYVSATSAPTPDSFIVTRAKDRITSETYVINATRANLEAATNGATVAPNTMPVIVPDDYACRNAAGNYVWTWQAPTKAGSEEYKAYVLLNNVQAVAALSAGHVSVAAMVTWLNTNYAAAGTWANPSGNLITLTSTVNNKVGLRIVVGDFS